MREFRTSIWVLAAIVCIAPAVARAQILKCASKTILAQDASNLLAAARRVAGPLMIDKPLRDVCMNPHYGRAWLGARSEPQQDGSEVTHRVHCERDDARWRCELSSNRHASVDLDRNGKHLHVDFSLPTDLNLALARHLVARAFEIAPGVSDAKECFALWNGNDPASGQAISKDVQNAFGLQDGSVDASIERDPDGKTLWVSSSDVALRFEPPTPEGEWLFTCWTFEVVIT